MKVEKLTLKNFRNMTDSTFYPGQSLNFLVGPNGQGKTSVLEALGFLSTLRSFRESKAAQVIQWGAESSDVSCTLSSRDGESVSWQTQLRIHFQASDPSRQKTSKIAFVNDKPFKSSTQYLSQRFGSYELGFHTIIFNPADHDLVRGDPSIRRSYLDRVIAAEDIEYLKSLQRYHRALIQRNALLKSPDKISPEVLMGFTEALCDSGIQITYKRLRWLNRVAEALNKTAKRIAPRQSELRIGYLSSWVPNIENLSFNNKELDSIHFTGQGHLASLELLEQAFWTKVSTLELAERKTGYSLVGPHRDDWAFFLGGQFLKGHGSQGEVRSALLALKLSEIELFQNETGHRPLFLLDDFSSELDRERSSFLLQFLLETDLQTFVTTTEDSSSYGKKYRVRNGIIEEGFEGIA